MARVLIERGLEPITPHEHQIHGADATRSAVTGRIYEDGSGALPRDVQDRLAVAEQKLGRRLTELEANLLIHSDPVDSAVDAAVRSIEEIK
jgi:hypothetical protein